MHVTARWALLTLLLLPGVALAAPTSAKAPEAKSPKVAHQKAAKVTDTKTDAPTSGVTKRWQIASAKLRIGAKVGALLIGRDGDELVAYEAASGKKRWGTRIGNLLPGPRTVAADKTGVYALGKTGLYVLAVDTGAIMHTESLRKPRSLLLRRGSLYVALRRGVVRFASGGEKRLGTSKKFSGELRGAHGQRVVLYRHLKKRKGLKGSPQRITVVDLAADKKLYEFRLLRRGGHRVVSFDGARLAFLDYTRLLKGKNARKLFYTEADINKNKKLRDVSLKNHYGDGKADTFWARPVGDSGLLLAQSGKGASRTSLLYLDLAAKRVRWKVEQKAPLSPPLRRGKTVWLAVGGAAPQLLTIDLETGKVRARHNLPKATVAAPRPGAKGQLLLRDQTGLMAVTPGRAAKPKTPGRTPKGYRRYQDALAGYTIELPKAWTLNAKHVKHFGKDSFAVPFMRYHVDSKKRYFFMASVHVLVRPDRGQSAEQLWTAVLNQRRNRVGRVKVLGVERIERNGVQQVHGRYSFTNRYRRQESARSLCVVSHGLAFELRARFRPEFAAKINAQLDRIFANFKVRPDLRKKSLRR